MVLHPAPDAEKGQVMPMFHATPHLAEKPQARVRIRAVAQMPAQVEQLIHLLTRHRPGLGQKIIDHLHRAPKTTGRRLALEVRSSRTSGQIGSGQIAQFFKVALSIHMVFSCHVRRSIIRSCVCRSFTSPAKSRNRTASSTTFSWATINPARKSLAGIGALNSFICAVLAKTCKPPMA